MMAKQSALNTKQVQKLKEKAKLAAEKRLKLMRKAQMKAIKQVERDEKHLFKLSNNRRLLKTAHSFSDIKLVGRSVNEPEREEILNSVSNSSVNNFIQNYKLQRDLMSNAGRFGNQLINFKHKTSISSNDSAYASSSVSSTSGYLSSSTSNASSSLFTLTARGQPKYSDLVALKQGEGKLLAKSQQKLSLKSSNSTIGVKLKGISAGVSRKVQLKRMLLNSTSDLRPSSLLSESPVASSSQAVNHHQSSQNLEINQHQQAQSSRLCNVQPTIKLKLNAELEQAKSDASSSTRANSIKWPPAPAMTKAISEPDFGAAAARLEAEETRETCRPTPGSIESVVDLNARQQAENLTNSGEKTRQTDSCDSPAMASESNKDRDESQHRLLTECLSQLKLRHEALRQDELQADQVNQSANKFHQAPVNSKPNSTSDELLQHQLTAGLVPLKPSIIKQQQQSNKLQATRLCTGIGTSTAGASDSIGSAGSLVRRDFTETSSSGSESTKLSSPRSVSKVPIHVEEQANNCPGELNSTRAKIITRPSNESETIETFLVASGLLDLKEVFDEERIDLEALVLLDEHDLKSLNILLGPRRKLLKAIEERRRLSSITKPMFIIVDTPL